MRQAYDQQDVETIKSDIKQQLHHSFLQQYVDIPEIDGEQVSLLFYMLQDSHCPPEHVSDVVTAVMAVQTALDTHDFVDGYMFRHDHSKKSRQLTVLSGDYYSSLYYYLLARIDNVALIAVMADAIQSINEHKMCLHTYKDESLEMMIEHIQVRESLLFQKVAQFYKGYIWGNFFKDYLLIQYLQRNKPFVETSESASLKKHIIACKQKKQTFYATDVTDESSASYILDVCIQHVGIDLRHLLSRYDIFENVTDQTLRDHIMRTISFDYQLANEG